MGNLISVWDKNSMQLEVGQLIISVKHVGVSDAKVVVGRPGFPNVQDVLSVGDALLFETHEGLFEVRIMTMTSFKYVDFLITQISPKPGILGGLVDKDPNNTVFTDDEIKKITSSIEEIKVSISKMSDITSEQFHFISRKFDEINDASKRLGRKDWMNLVVGILTNTIISLALNQNTAKTMFQVANTALSWVLGGMIKLLY